MKIAIAILTFFSSGIAVGYPELVAEHGYSSCAACHISPSGGGVLNPYGRGFADELSTVQLDNAGSFAYGLVNPPDWLDLGGDLRYLDVRTPEEAQHFLMQDDVEIAVHPSKEIRAVASYGHYYGSAKPESRRHYVAWSPNDYVTVRVGHYVASYGLNLPDHTAATREPLGYGEGQESYNVEASYRDKFSEIFLTAVAGDGTTFTASHNRVDTAPQNNAYVARASYFVSQGYTLGASYEFKYDSEHIFEQTMGPYVMMGLTAKSYLLAEFDRRLVGGSHFDVSYTELGYEVFRGIHVQATHEYEQGNVCGLGLQIFPISHFELLAKAKYEAVTGDIISEILVHLNW